MNLTTPTKEAAMIEILNLIELTPENRGDVPESVTHLVEVPVLIGQPMPDYFLVWDNVRWLRRSASGGFFKPGHFEHRFARPATQSEIEAFRGRITDGTVTDPSNRGRESGVSSETLPDETAPPALARVESDLTAQSGGSIRPNKRLNWGEEMANAWQRGEFGNEPLLPAAKPLTFGRYMVEGGKAYRLLEPDEVVCAGDEDNHNVHWMRTCDDGARVRQCEVGRYRRPLDSTPATYALLQTAWCEHFGVKVGTRVRVVRIPASYEIGWPSRWTPAMDAIVSGTVVHIGDDIIIETLPDRPICGFPFHVLEVLEPQPAETCNVACKAFLLITEPKAPRPPAGSEGEDFTVDDYATAARVIALHLDEFCDKSKLYPDMIADAARKASAQLTALRSAAEGAREFIRNGIEFGYIRMPDPETPDKAHLALPALDAALAEGVQRE